MSDLSLSFLIQNQNEVEIDKSYLEKCQRHQEDPKPVPSSMSKVVSSKEIKLNRNKNLIATKKKVGSPRSYNLQSNSEAEPEDSNIAKLSIRVESLEENQKRMEKRIGIQFFQLKEEIQKRSVEQTEQFEQVRRLKGGLKETKKNIAELLTLISKRK